MLDNNGLKLEENTTALTQSVGVLVFVILVNNVAFTIYKLCDYLK
jgi:hypothetical protein